MTEAAEVSNSAEVTAAIEQRRSESQAALERYRHANRRRQLVYFSIVGALVIALTVVVSVAWSHGEVANTTLHTVADPPASLSIQSPAPQLHVSWKTADRAAIGVPQWGGTVVVYGTHTVRGVDARTGATTWSYSRSDRTVCTAAQAGGITMAVYEVGGNCDEVTGLDSDTGQRNWTRTLDFNGQPLNGHPAYQVLPDAVMFTTPSVIYAINPVSGYDIFTYSHFGCAIEHAVLGSAGALISQNCTTPRCGTLRFCGSGQQLLLRSGSVDRKDSDTKNPDVIMWNRLGDSDTPVSADGVVSALNTTTHDLDLLTASNGKPQNTVPLSPAPISLQPITASSADDAEVIWIGGVAYAVQPGRTTAIWSARTPTSPSVLANSTNAALVLSRARITVATSSGVRTLDGSTGRTVQSFTLPTPTAGSVVYPVGAGFLVAAGTGTVVYS